jgi:hypothetical protein
MEHDIGQLAEAAISRTRASCMVPIARMRKSLKEARNYEREERIPWPMSIDDFGRHRAVRARWASRRRLPDRQPAPPRSWPGRAAPCEAGAKR